MIKQFLRFFEREEPIKDDLVFLSQKQGRATHLFRTVKMADLWFLKIAFPADVLQEKCFEIRGLYRYRVSFFVLTFSTLIRGGADNNAC